MSPFEVGLRKLTEPINGQYPRPWMTDLHEPARASVFVVGHNQAKAYSVEAVGDHERFLNALFNRNGESCRGLYNEITDGQPSETRENLDWFNGILTDAGVRGIIETNAVCYSTRMSAHLSEGSHRPGRQRGRQLFRYVLESIRPPVVIAHGSGTIQELRKVFGPTIPDPAMPPQDVAWTDTAPGRLFVVPSLAQPGFNHWKRWASTYLEKVARAVADHLRSGSSAAASR
jgi:hypothetical protein